MGGLTFRADTSTSVADTSTCAADTLTRTFWQSEALTNPHSAHPMPIMGTQLPRPWAWPCYSVFYVVMYYQVSLIARTYHIHRLSHRPTTLYSSTSTSKAPRPRARPRPRFL